MEIDPINIARKVTNSLSPKEVEGKNAPAREHQIDFSTEHTNGRLFEQAVQNANKTHEVSAPPETITGSDSKVDAKDKSAHDRPLVLNNGDPRSTMEMAHEREEKRKLTGEEALLEALKQRNINIKTLSQLTLDLIALKGEKIDEQTTKNNVHSENSPETEADASKPSGNINLDTEQTIISFSSKRTRIEKIAEATYQDILRIEDGLGNRLDESLAKELNHTAFVKEVVLRVFD